jgi:hypothetical protein
MVSSSISSIHITTTLYRVRNIDVKYYLVAWILITHTHTHTCPAGIERSPKMDVVESGVNYVLKIEIPGVNVSDIRVEIHGQK